MRTRQLQRKRTEIINKSLTDVVKLVQLANETGRDADEGTDWLPLKALIHQGAAQMSTLALIAAQLQELLTLETEALPDNEVIQEPANTEQERGA